MKRMILALCLSSIGMLTAVSPAQCSSQLMGVLGVLCPECYQHYLDTQGN